MPLVQQWEVFQEENPGGTVEQFAVWVLQQTSKTHAPVSPVVKPQTREEAVKVIPNMRFSDPSAAAAYFLTRLYKFIRFYCKPVLQNLGLNSTEDFALLASIDWLGETNKKELCKLNVVELTTGLDIIRRFIKHGWVAERTDSADKRARILSLTDQGRSVIGRAYQRMQSVPDVLVDLPESVRMQLLAWLQSLNAYHTKVYENS